MSILSMKNIQKSFGKNEVLKDISLEVNKGEVVSTSGCRMSSSITRASKS